MPVRGKIQVPGSASKIPFRHNSSVENFWYNIAYINMLRLLFHILLLLFFLVNRMLVNMGDLPQPENDVLSETLTSKIRKTTENDSTAGRSGHSSGSRKRSAADSVDGGSCANSVGIDSLPVSSMDLNYNTVLKSMKQESMLPHSANAGTNVPSDEFIFSSTMKNLYFPPTSSDSVAVQVGSTAEQKN